VEPIQWNFLPSQENVNFFDNVNVDENVAIKGVLSDTEILDHLFNIDEVVENDIVISCNFERNQSLEN
jgi:hypothetical protein